MVSVVYDTRASWLQSGILGLLHLAFHHKNIYTRTTLPCEPSCNTQEKHFCFVLLRVLVTCSPEHKKDFRQNPPQVTPQYFLLHKVSPDILIQKILEQSIAKYVHYYHAVILFADRVMLSDQAETAV